MTARSHGPSHHARGSVSIIAVAGALTLSLIALCAADLGSMLLARARARSAADAAALAAVVDQAAALAGGEAPGDAAGEQASLNGAVLLSCDCSRGNAYAEVSVGVTPSISIVSGWFGRTVHASARAELDADVLSYRDAG